MLKISLYRELPSETNLPLIIFLSSLQKNAMYTTQKSIDNKAGSVSGWKDLLMAVGFRFEPATSSIPSSVFFPQSDPDERLSTASASLQALLGKLSQNKN